MSNVITCCTVSSLNECNNATNMSNNVTHLETSNATVSLIDLARRILARNQHNQSHNCPATSQLRLDATNLIGVINSKSCVVALTKGGNYATPTPKVKCDNCEHFQLDNIGESSEIGKCGLGVMFTQEVIGQQPLSRYLERHCVNFSKLMR